MILTDEEVGWRYGQLLRHKWSKKNATIIASLPDVDLHRACEMLDMGATERQALIILLPDDMPLPVEEGEAAPEMPRQPTIPPPGVTVRIVS